MPAGIAPRKLHIFQGLRCTATFRDEKMRGGPHAPDAKMAAPFEELANYSSGLTKVLLLGEVKGIDVLLVPGG